MIAVGGIVGWLAERRLSRAAASTCAALRRRGVLLASGFLVGESVVGIAIAVSDVGRGKSNSLALHIANQGWRGVAVLLFAGIIYAFYKGISDKHSH